MKTTINIQEMLEKAEKVNKVCKEKIEYLEHPEIYGSSLRKCNSIVINKERMMTVTTDENHMTTYEFSPTYPRYFTPEAAQQIVENDIYKDINGDTIKLEIIGEKEYYNLLKARMEAILKSLKLMI